LRKTEGVLLQHALQPSADAFLAEPVAVLNDTDRMVSTGVIDALPSYEIEPFSLLKSF
jgi:hypothetical protein